MKITTLPKTFNQLSNQLEGIVELIEIAEAAAGNMGLKDDRDWQKEGTLLEYLEAAQYALTRANEIVGHAQSDESRAKQRERNVKYAHHRKAYYARCQAAAGKESTRASSMAEAEMAWRAAEKHKVLDAHEGCAKDTESLASLAERIAARYANTGNANQ